MLGLPSESPMCLDTSIDQQHKEKELTERERQDFLLTVPEYTEEIYAHLREQEVSTRIFSFVVVRRVR